MGTQLVWFKRDLRVADHRPLAEAARCGPCICLYVYEPIVHGGESFDASHLEFINQSLRALDGALQGRGGFLTLRQGEMLETLDRLWEATRFETIWAHEETGDAATYARDEAVRAWARGRGVAMREFPQNGVVRRLGNRDGWARRWNQRMTTPPWEAPERIEAVKIAPGRVLGARALGLPPNTKRDLQRGGEDAGRETLRSFLEERGAGYRHGMSSPVTAWEGCSRLSPHLAFGTISMRQVYQASKARRAEIKERQAAGEKFDQPWLASLSAFDSRLRWHCHFMQKLEDEPRIEFENLHRAADGLREDDWNEGYFQAWQAGQTGYPMVDACMRALLQHGWINFRMRAMLVSFAAYHLWLHWRRPAVFLARHFVDYEPGIHYSQFQMQSGTTGINTVRIYSPIKQVLDHDPRGVFIRRYVPELAGVPDAFLAEPHRMGAAEQRRAGCRIGRDYPAPVVEHAEAYALAQQRMRALRRSPEARRESEAIVSKHGSRKRPGNARATGKRKAALPEA